MIDQAVVIIDVQNGVLEDPGMARRAETYAAFDEVVGRIAKLIVRARAKGVPVLFVQHDEAAGEPLAVGSTAWQIRPEITPAANEPVIHKTACDSFFETTLGAELEARGIRKLIVAGCMTQYCIDTSVRRAVSLGYDVTLVADGHMTSDSGGLRFEQIIAHHNGILDGFRAGRHGVSVVGLDGVLS